MIYLLRHGETDWNKKDLMQGQVDIHLNEKGKSQAQALNHSLSHTFDKVYVSPLTRAIETAQIVVPDINPIVDERLLEFSYGPYEGKSLYEVDDDFKNFLFHPLTVLPPEGVETMEHLNNRIASFIKDINLEEDVLIVSHGVAIRSFISNLTDLNPWGVQIENCTLYTIKDNKVIKVE